MSPLPEGLRARVDRASDLPLGAQLARSLRDWIRQANPETRLPSVRELAGAAGVNVNTARAVYQRLEHEGLVRSEQGRGTFVSGSNGEAAQRAELRRQIALLEGELARRPAGGGDPFSPTPRQPARLMSAGELLEVRDGLLGRLRELDATRAEILERLAELEHYEQAERVEEDAESRAAARPIGGARRSTLSVPGARVRWVGA